MQRRSPSTVDVVVWGSAACLLLVGLGAAPAWEALDPALQAELALLEESADDPWGRPFALADDGVRSAGPDRVWESPDDLTLSPDLSRARVARVLPGLAVLGVVLLAIWELGFLVVGLMRGPWKGWFDEALLAGGWAALGGSAVWGVVELLARREVLHLPTPGWLAVSPETAAAVSLRSIRERAWTSSMKTARLSGK